MARLGPFQDKTYVRNWADISVSSNLVIVQIYLQRTNTGFSTWGTFTADVTINSASFSKTVKISSDDPLTNVAKLVCTVESSGAFSNQVTISYKLTSSGTDNLNTDRHSGTFDVPQSWGYAGAPRNVKIEQNGNTLKVSGEKGANGVNNIVENEVHIYYKWNSNTGDTGNYDVGIGGIKIDGEGKFLADIVIPNASYKKIGLTVYTLSQRGDNPGTRASKDNLVYYQKISNPTIDVFECVGNRPTPNAEYKIEWSEPTQLNNNTLEGYLVYYKINGGTDNELTSVDKDVTSWQGTIPGLQKGDTLQLGIKALSVVSSDFDSDISYPSKSITVVSRGTVWVKTIVNGANQFVEGEVWVKTPSGYVQADAVYINVDGVYKESI